MSLPPVSLIIGFDLKCSLGWDAVALLPCGRHAGSFAGRGRPAGWREQLALTDEQRFACEQAGSVCAVLERPVLETRGGHELRRQFDDLQQTQQCLAGWASFTLHSTVQNGRLLAPTCADVRRWAEESRGGLAWPLKCPTCGGSGDWWSGPASMDFSVCTACNGTGEKGPFPWRGEAKAQDGWIKAFCTALGYDTQRGHGLGNADQRDALMCARFGLARLSC